MQTTTLSFSNTHDPGMLFTNVLPARHESFIVDRKRDIPQTEGMEFGQYDTPQGLWMSRIGYHCETAGPKLDIEGAMNRVVKMSLVNTLN